MKKPNIENLEKDIENKFRKRDDKKKMKMKVDSANLKKLKRLISKKGAS